MGPLYVTRTSILPFAQAILVNTHNEMTLWLDWTISFQLLCTTPSLDLLFLGTIFSASDVINTEMFFKFKWLF